MALSESQRITDPIFSKTKMTISPKFFEKKMGFVMPSYDALYRKAIEYEEKLIERDKGCEYCKSGKAKGNKPKVTIHRLQTTYGFGAYTRMVVEMPNEIKAAIDANGIAIQQQTVGGGVAIDIDYCPFCGRKL